MSRYFLTQRAVEDVEALVGYYGARSLRFAEKLARDLTIAFKLVGRSPLIGTPVDGLSLGLRRKPVGQVIVYFRGTPTGTEIVRVLHSSRDVLADDFSD